MKRLNIALLFMVSLLIMSCSKEEEEMPPVYERDLIESDSVLSDSTEVDLPLGFQVQTMKLDMSEIKYPVEVLPMGGDNDKCFYMIEIPKEGAEVILVGGDNDFALSEISVGSFKNIVKDYCDFTWWYHVNPYYEPEYEELSDYPKFYRYDSKIGLFEHTELSKLKCKIPVNEEKGNKAISIHLLTSDVRGCLVIFIQKSEI